MDMTNEKLREILASVQSSGIAFAYQPQLTEPEYSIDRAAAEIMALLGADTARLDKLESLLRSPDHTHILVWAVEGNGGEVCACEVSYETVSDEQKAPALRQAIDAVPERDV